mgnify:CR=1 FL=1
MNLLIGLDQWVNTLIGGAPDETISSRAARGKRDGRWYGRFLCRGLDWLDPNHCDDALKSERGRTHLPEEFRNPNEHPKP